MAKVYLDFKDKNGKPIVQTEIYTGGDSAYILHDIQNYLHEDGEFSNVPKGTKEISIRIHCDM